MPAPSAAILTPCHTMSPRTLLRLAPMAIRIPISWLRWATVYDNTPYSPTAARTSASPANTPNIVLPSRRGLWQIRRGLLHRGAHRRDQVFGAAPSAHHERGNECARVGGQRDIEVHRRVFHGTEAARIGHDADDLGAPPVTTHEALPDGRF